MPWLEVLLRTQESPHSIPNWKPNCYLLKYAGLSERPPTLNSQQSQVIKLHLFLWSISWQADLASCGYSLSLGNILVFPITLPPNKVQDKLVAGGEKCLMLHFVFL